MPSVSPAGRGGCQKINRANKYDKQGKTNVRNNMENKTKATQIFLQIWKERRGVQTYIFEKFGEQLIERLFKVKPKLSNFRN